MKLRTHFGMEIELDAKMLRLTILRDLSPKKKPCVVFWLVSYNDPRFVDPFFLSSRFDDLPGDSADSTQNNAKNLSPEN